MSLLSRLRSEGVLLLHHDYRGGSFQDLSGNSKHGTPTVCELRKGALRFSSATGAEVDAGADTIGTGAGSVVVQCLSRGGGESGGGRLFDNGAFSLYTSATGQLSYGFGTIRPGSAGGLSVGVDHVVVASWDATGIANLYIDGSLDDGPGTIGAPSGGTDMTVGNRPALDRQFDGDIYLAAAINRELTPAEVTELTAELRASRPDVRGIITTVDSAGDRYSQMLGNGARVTTSNLSAGQQVPGTPIYVDSGTWSVGVEDVNGKPSKVLTCETAGIVYAKWSDLRNNPAEAAYGTWEFLFSKGGSSTVNIMPFCSIIATPATVGQDAMLFQFVSAEKPYMYTMINGGYNLGLFRNFAYSADTFYHMKITRNSSGVTYCYWDGEILPITSGSNPFTENTVTEGAYFVCDFDAGDKLALSTLAGEPLFRKYYGVI